MSLLFNIPRKKISFEERIFSKLSNKTFNRQNFDLGSYIAEILLKPVLQEVLPEKILANEEVLMKKFVGMCSTRGSVSRRFGKKIIIYCRKYPIKNRK